MIDKLKVWNFTTMHDSRMRLKPDDVDMLQEYDTRLELIIRSMSAEDKDWLDKYVFSGDVDAWSKPNKLDDVLLILDEIPG